MAARAARRPQRAPKGERAVRACSWEGEAEDWLVVMARVDREALFDRMAELMRPEGWLYIGHSERVTGPAADMLATMGPTIYRKRPA